MKTGNLITEKFQSLEDDECSCNALVEYCELINFKYSLYFPDNRVYLNYNRELNYEEKEE
jgi:hypothetical protein